MSNQIMSNPELELTSSDSGFNIKEFIGKYLKYLPIVILGGLIGLIIAYMQLRYAVPIYSVRSSMLISKNGQKSVADDKFDLFMGGGGQNLFNDMVILKSRPVLQRVSRNLHIETIYYKKGNVKTSFLYENAPLKLEIVSKKNQEDIPFSMEVNLNPDGRTFMLNGSKKISFGESFEYNEGDIICRLLCPNPIIKNDDSNKKTQDDYIIIHRTLLSSAESLIGGLSLKKNEQADILELSYVSESKELGRDVLNNLMAVYDSMNIEDKNRTAVRTLQFIAERLDTVKVELGQIEGGLEGFMERNRLYDIDAQGSELMSRYSDYFGQQSALNLKLSVINWLIKYAEEPKNKNKVLPVLGIEEPSLIALVAKYNEAILELDNNLKTTQPSNSFIVQLEAEIDKSKREIIVALNNVKQSYLIADKDIEKNSSSIQSELVALPSKSRSMLEMKRKQQIMQDLYSFLLQKQMETSLSSASAISPSRIVESAIMDNSPVAPQRRNYYMMGLLIGLLIPIGGIAIKELLNDKVNSRLDIEKITNTPVLGEVGHAKPEDLPLVLKNSSRKFIAEQFRIIRTNLQYILNKIEKPVIMVTSTFSGEGKSFVSTNMGAVMALTGKRTIILEFDIRKPKVAEGLGINARRGITNFIVGNNTLEELIIPIKDMEGLFLLPCGPIPPNPAELLLSPAIKELFLYVKKNYDVVIIDTAPVGVVTDALVLGEWADAALYIVRQGYTLRKQINFIDDLYKQKKLHNQAIIINDVEIGKGYGYGSYGYGYGYGYGHSSGEKSGYFDDKKKKGFWAFLSRKK